MLRVLFVGLLVLLVACKSKQEAPKTGVAGKVIEVSGTVSVQHKDVARPLASGDAVEAEDTIETGADGHVVIELAHNNARWELGANKKEVVRESVAWRLAKAEGNAKAGEADTSAAGRPAERSAAETSATAPVAAGAAAPEATAVPVPPAVTADQEKKDTKAPPTADRARVEQAPLNQAASKGATNAVGRAAPSGGGGGAGVSPLEDTSGPSATDRVAKDSNALKKCLTSDVPDVDLTITVDAKGTAKTTVSASNAVPAKVKQCIAAAVQKIKFAHEAATVRVQISR